MSTRRIIWETWSVTRRGLTRRLRDFVRPASRASPGNYDSTVATGYKHCGCRYEDPRQEELSHLSFAWTLEHTSAESKAFLRSLPFRIDLRPLGGHCRRPDRHAAPRQPGPQHRLRPRGPVRRVSGEDGDRRWREGGRRGVLRPHAQAVAPRRRRSPLREHGERWATQGRRPASRVHRSSTSGSPAGLESRSSGSTTTSSTPRRRSLRAASPTTSPTISEPAGSRWRSTGRVVSLSVVRLRSCAIGAARCSRSSLSIRTGGVSRSSNCPRRALATNAMTAASTMSAANGTTMKITLTPRAPSETCVLSHDASTTVSELAGISTAAISGVITPVTASVAPIRL